MVWEKYAAMEAVAAVLPGVVKVLAVRMEKNVVKVLAAMRRKKNVAATSVTIRTLKNVVRISILIIGGSGIPVLKKKNAVKVNVVMLARYAVVVSARNHVKKRLMNRDAVLNGMKIVSNVLVP